MYGVHKVRTAEGSRMAGAMGVSSDRPVLPPPGHRHRRPRTRATAWADDDTHRRCSRTRR